jgi:uncharacterized membrane protein YeaQ/YmgE (transglycosylase-associated protein family)
MTIAWVVGLGAVIGLAARFVFTRHGIGILQSVGIGIGGAVLGWWIGDAATRHLSRESQLLCALAGAIVVLIAAHVVASRRRTFARRRGLWRGHLVKRRFRT